MIGKNKPRFRTKEQNRQHNKEWRKRVKIDVISHYGYNSKPICVNCGFGDIRALSIDHIFNDGCSQRKLMPETKGSCFYSWLRKHHYPIGYQTLCMNCQFIKRFMVFEERNQYKGV